MQAVNTKTYTNNTNTYANTNAFPYIEDADNILRKLTLSGIASRYSGEQKRQALVRREEELEIVKHQGTAAGYLTVLNALQETKAKPEEFCLRGTIGSSLVAYAIGLSDIDPMNSTPRLYPEFFFGIYGDRKPSFDMVVTPELLDRLPDWFAPYEQTLAVFEDEEEYVQAMLDHPVFLTCEPKTFGDFVKCYGFINSTGAWTDNAEKLLKDGVAPFSELIATREDVYEYLVNHGVSTSCAFQIAEDVRMGKINRRGWKGEQLWVMDRAGIPDWFIRSCEKIGYLYPRAHAMVMLKRYLTE
ncbi:MAG: hypothetical protein J6Y10_01685 [Lachnospiraceae bacterium]|nr:hypothetical protein [Lachnospiraceae bacterium]